MATGANGAVGAFGTGSSAGYILILFLFTGFLAMLTGNVENAKTVITYLLLFSRLIWIKFNMNMPKFLTATAEEDTGDADPDSVSVNKGVAVHASKGLRDRSNLLPSPECDARPSIHLSRILAGRILFV